LEKLAALAVWMSLASHPQTSEQMPRQRLRRMDQLASNDGGDRRALKGASVER
jgi:hypothetical protein